MRVLALTLLLSLVLCPASKASEAYGAAIGAEMYLQQADQALREGRIVQAGQMIEWLEQNSNRVSPDDVALIKAEFAIINGDVASAANSVNAIADPFRNGCRQDTVRGWVAANQNKLDAATSALTRAAKKCPADPGVWNLLGLVFIKNGEKAAGQEAMGRALSLVPNNAELLNNFAIALVQQGELELAMKQLDLAAVADPDNQLILANRDFLSGMMGKMPLRRDSDSDAVWSTRLVNIGKGATAAQNLPEATALFSRAVLLQDYFEDAMWVATGSHARSDAQ